MRSATALLFALLLARPALAQEEPAWKDDPPGKILARLGSADVGVRIQAARLLRARGDDGRRALEHFLAPDLVGPPGAPEPPVADEGLAERVRKLVADLGADEFDVREAATRDLAALGAPALPFLREVDSTDPEVKNRVAGIVARIEGPSDDPEDATLVRREATAALASFASPGSVPVLRRLVASGDAWIASVADTGLRMISATWPEPGAKKGEERLEAWDVALEKAVPAGGEPWRVAGRVLERYPEGARVRAKADTEFRFRLGGDFAAMLGGAGAPPEFVFRVRSTFEDRVEPAIDPPAIVRKYDTYEFTAEMGALGGAGGPPGPELAGRTIHLPFEGPLAATTPEGEALADGERSMIERGLAFLSLFPGGELRPGERLVLETADPDRSPIPFLSDPHAKSKSLDATGSIAYLGPDAEGRPRFRLAYAAAVLQDEAGTSAVQRFWLAGEVVLDATSGLVDSYRVEGAWQTSARPGAGAGETIEMEGGIVSRFEAVE